MRSTSSSLRITLRPSARSALDCSPRPAVFFVTASDHAADLSGSEGATAVAPHMAAVCGTWSSTVSVVADVAVDPHGRCMSTYRLQPARRPGVASARRAGGTVTRTPSNSSRLTPRAVSSSRSHSDRSQFLTGEPDDHLPTPRLGRPRPTLPHSPRPFLRGELHKAHPTNHGLSNRGRANAAVPRPTTVTAARQCSFRSQCGSTASEG